MSIYEPSIQFLKNAYQVTGTSFEDFREMVKVMDEKTFFIKVNCCDIHLWNPFFDFSESKEVIPTYRVFPEDTSFKKDKEEVYKTLLSGKARYTGFCPAFHLQSEEMTSDDLDEMMNDSHRSGTFVSVLDEFYYASDEFISRLAYHLGITGDALRTPSIERNNFVAYMLSMYGPKEITLIYREELGVKKLMDARSGRYESIPQENIIRVIDMLNNAGMGTATCRSWIVNHEFTRINLEFPEKAVDFNTFYEKDDEMVPGLEISTSDLGQNSFTVRGTWTINGSTSVHEEVARKHFGEIKLDEIVENVKKNIFAEYLQFPNKLAELIKIDITDDSCSEQQNEKKIEAAIEIASNACELTKIIGKKREKALCTQMLYEFDAAEIVTAYDIAIAFLEIPKRINLGDEKKLHDRISTSVKNAVFADYSAVKDTYYDVNGEPKQIMLDLN